MYWLYWTWDNLDVNIGEFKQFDTLAEANEMIGYLTDRSKKSARLILGEEIPIVEDPK